jgi:hypothetical protein
MERMQNKLECVGFSSIRTTRAGTKLITFAVK